MALSTTQTSAEDFFHEGTRLLRAGTMADAENALRKALCLDSELAEAHANLGLLLDQTGRVIEAEAAYLQALALAPEQCQVLINLGALRLDQKRFAEAEESFLRALDLNPESAAAWSNYGVLLACCKREAEAERCYRRAISLAPEYRSAAFNLAYILLRQGRFEEGWRCLEARQWYEQLDRELGIPRWCGESLAGKSILIGIEAGHGDMIQFCRFAGKLKERGAARVSVLCHPPLKRLFHRLDGLDEILAVGDPAPGAPWDCWCPPLSLPYFFDIRLNNIPSHLPYLSADPQLAQKWAALIDNPDGKLRVGLVWKGNPRFENDRERSLPSLNELTPLSDVSGIRYFSLQKGVGEDEAASPPFPLIHLGGSITDFADTAAIIANLDLVITVDTAVAHLAGAMGKPCWVMLPYYKTDWRWLTGREDSPWYPGVMRLFRQGSTGMWSPVISDIGSALEASTRSGTFSGWIA